MTTDRRRTTGPAILYDGITFYGHRALREYQARKARREIRETCRALSDEALAFQLATGVGGMHREELVVEQLRRTVTP